MSEFARKYGPHSEKYLELQNYYLLSKYDDPKKQNQCLTELSSQVQGLQNSMVFFFSFKYIKYLSLTNSSMVFILFLFFLKKSSSQFSSGQDLSAPVKENQFNLDALVLSKLNETLKSNLNLNLIFFIDL